MDLFLFLIFIFIFSRLNSSLQKPPSLALREFGAIEHWLIADSLVEPSGQILIVTYWVLPFPHGLALELGSFVLRTDCCAPAAAAYRSKC